MLRHTASTLHGLHQATSKQSFRTCCWDQADRRQSSAISCALLHNLLVLV